LARDQSRGSIVRSGKGRKNQYCCPLRVELRYPADYRLRDHRARARSALTRPNGPQRQFASFGTYPKRIEVADSRFTRPICHFLDFLSAVYSCANYHQRSSCRQVGGISEKRSGLALQPKALDVRRFVSSAHVLVDQAASLATGTARSLATRNARN
jgi:hypothetical protein